MPADNVYATKFMVDDIKENNDRNEVVLYHLMSVV